MSGVSAAGRAPVLEGDGVRLRPHCRSDFESLAAFYASADARHMGGPMPPREAWFWFASDVAQWELQGHGGWAIETPEGDFAGQIVLNAPPFFPERELGWLLFSGHRGRGLATRAARLARGHAYRVLGWAGLVSYIKPDNAPALALAARLGARRDPEGEPFERGYDVYRHPGPETAA